MLKEYSDKIEEVKKDVTKKLADQTIDMNKKFDQQKAELTELLNELVTTGKITANKQD